MCVCAANQNASSENQKASSKGEEGFSKERWVCTFQKCDAASINGSSGAAIVSSRALLVVAKWQINGSGFQKHAAFFGHVPYVVQTANH